MRIDFLLYRSTMEYQALSSSKKLIQYFMCFSMYLKASGSFLIFDREYKLQVSLVTYRGSHLLIELNAAQWAVEDGTKSIARQIWTPFIRQPVLAGHPGPANPNLYRPSEIIEGEEHQNKTSSSLCNPYYKQ